MGRHLKQLIYGAAYLAVLAFFFYGIYAVFFRLGPSCTNGRQDPGEEGVDCGGVCALACLPSDLQPLQVVGVIVRHPAEGVVTIVGKVQNPNITLAARHVSYEFRFSDADGNVVRSSSPVDTFLYAGEVRYIPYFTNDSTIPPGGSVDLVLGEPEWVKAGEFPEPNVVIVDRNVSSTDTQLTVTGHVTNRDVVNLPQVTVIALFYDPAGRSPLGASVTTVDNLQPGETREFAVVHPPIPDYDPARLELVTVAKR
jgi:hypothetical protein